MYIWLQRGILRVRLYFHKRYNISGSFKQEVALQKKIFYCLSFAWWHGPKENSAIWVLLLHCLYYMFT